MNKLLLLTSILLLTACSPKKFYTLGDNLNIQSKQSSSQTIDVVKVLVPKYLKEPKIVRQVAPYQIELIDKTEWLVPMENKLTEILIDYLQQSMNNPNVHLYPWDSNANADKRLSLNIQKFIATNTEVTLIANYKILNLNSKKQSIKHFETHVPTSKDVNEMMKSMEKAYLELMEEIGEVLM